MKKSSLVLALAVFAVASSLWAQTSRATLGGRVTDAQGSAVPNAERFRGLGRHRRETDYQDQRAG